MQVRQSAEPLSRNIASPSGISRFALAIALVLHVLGLAPPVALAQGTPETIPYASGTVSLSGPTDELVLEIDLESPGIPVRPRIVAAATADAANPSLQLDVEFFDCDAHPFYTTPGGTSPEHCPSNLFPWMSDPVTSPGVAVADLPACLPLPLFGFAATELTDPTCFVRVSSPDAPGLFSFAIRAETSPPTGRVVDPEIDATPTLTTLDLVAEADNTLIESPSNQNAGASATLFAGGQAPTPFTSVDNRPVLRFPVNESITLADQVQLQGATLELTATNAFGFGGSFDVHPIDEGSNWIEGDKDRTTADSGESTWVKRNFSDWNAAGGDFGAASASLPLSGPGLYSFSSTALTDDVQEMLLDETNEGWLLTGPPVGAGTPGFFTVGVDFASREDPVVADRPTLRVDYIPVAGAEGTAQIGTVPYIQEGSNFRWLYDEQSDGAADDVLATPVGGLCEAINVAPTEVTQVEYTYLYQGDADYEGWDCCLYQIDSVLGVTGAGYILEPINIDPLLFPLDQDQDNIDDPCDNCLLVPNGPALGTCIGGTGDGTACTFDAACGGGRCSMAQDPFAICLGGPAEYSRCIDDAECGAGGTCERMTTGSNATLGVACPEPGLAAALACGVFGLAMCSRRRPVTASC